MKSGVADQFASTRDGLWANAADSIRHALDHFTEREMRRADRRHHDKWIILSVHQAAECICNMRLLELAPQRLLQKDGSIWFLSLAQSLEDLLKPDNKPSLGAAEQQLFVLMSELSAIRNQLMHRIAPEEIDVSIAAMSMMGLLKYVEQLRGVSASDIVWQNPPIETNVYSAIRYTRHAEYGDFVSAFLKEKHGDRWLGLCPACGVRGVVGSTCDACFTELGAVECPNCHETAYYDLFIYSKKGSAAAECECGKIVHV